jgi:hypothetical protein
LPTGTRVEHFLPHAAIAASGGALMKRSMLAFAIVACAAFGVHAQEVKKVTRESSVKIKDGRDVKVIGCVHRASSGFALSNLSGNSDKTRYYRLAFDGNDHVDDVEKYLGQKVEIKGLAATSDDAKVEVRTKEKREIEDGPDQKRDTKTTIEGDMPGFPLLKVEHVKRISESCPAGS